MALLWEGVLPEFVGEVATETFAIGDVHGQADLLDAVLGEIASTPRTAAPRRLVQLGDVIDRGPESLRSIDLLIAAPGRLGHEVTCLMGNHETMLLGAIAPSRAHPKRRSACFQVWYRNGGMAVVDELEREGLEVKGSLTVEAFVEAFGQPRLDFLVGLSPFLAEGDGLLFVHAGVHPLVPLRAFLGQPWHALRDDEDFEEEWHWAWIREPFLDHLPRAAGLRGHHGRFVVHGHTPQDGVRLPIEAQVARDRLNLDGYAYARRKLRYARILGRSIEVHEVEAVTAP